VSAALATPAARFAAAIATGLLLALSRPPVDLGLLACIALVPLFVAWRDRGPKASAGYAFVAGAVYYTVLCSWLWYFGPIAIVPFVIVLAGFWALAGAVIGWLRARGLTNPFLTAAIWVCADAVITRVPFGGFSWGEVGYAFHDLAAGRAVASVGGVTLATFLAVALNAFLADLVGAGQHRMRYVRVGAGTLVIAAIVIGVTATHSDPPVTSRLRVALIQGNDKNRDLTAAEERDRYLPRSHFELAREIKDPVDLIVFPESSMDGDPRTDPYIKDRVAAIARKHEAWVLANATVDADPKGKKALNLNVLFAPDGSIAGTYAKRHLVPFGEVIPFRSVLEKFVSEIDKVPRDFAQGKGRGIFPVANSRIGELICFESAFGYQVRPLVRDGADVLVVSTNNRSYRTSANSAQHLAIGQMRAAETGRPVVQAAISGITAIIDADGTVHDQTKLFDRRVVESTIAGTGGQTPYVRFGEWALYLCLIGVAVAVVLGVVRRRREAVLQVAAAAEVIPVDTRIVGYELPEQKEEVHD
jgi:apolipoprotein N-acyltransferase